MSKKTKEKKEKDGLDELEKRSKKVDIMDKIEQVKQRRALHDNEMKLKEIEIKANPHEKLESDIFTLLIAASVKIIDEDKTVSGISEPVYKNLFDEEDLTIIRGKIITKIKQF